MERSPGSAEGLLEIYSHKFKGGKISMPMCFPPTELAVWVQAQQMVTQLGFIGIRAFLGEYHGGKKESGN